MSEHGDLPRRSDGDSSAPFTKDWDTVQRERRIEIARQAGRLADRLLGVARPTQAQRDETIVTLRECEKLLLEDAHRVR